MKTIDFMGQRKLATVFSLLLLLGSSGRSLKMLETFLQFFSWIV